MQIQLAAYELEDEPAIESKLVSSTSVTPIKTDAIKSMFAALTGEEVPPKAAYLVVGNVLDDSFCGASTTSTRSMACHCRSTNR